MGKKYDLMHDKDDPAESSRNATKKTGSPAKMTGRAYDAEKAYDKDLSDSARLHYLENERHDAKKRGPVKKDGSMKGDQSATHKDYANYKGTDKGYHGHTGASHGDQSATHKDYEGHGHMSSVHKVLKHSHRM